MKIDRLVGGLLRFPAGQASFTCSMQVVGYQRMQVLGTRGRIEVPIPFSPQADRPARIIVDDGRDFLGSGVETIERPGVDQYEIQADRFADAVRGRGALPVPLQDAVANMAVIDALFRSAESRRWEKLAS